MKNISPKLMTVLIFKAVLMSLIVVFTIGSVDAFALQPESGKTNLGTANAVHGVITDLSVSFAGCVETIGVALVPTANAQEFVPPEFILVGTGQPVTPLVVRTALCSISVDGQSSGTGKIVQIGAVIVPPDGTGDINNYTIFYDTSDVRLALLLNLAGVRARFVPTIQYHHRNDNSFSVLVPPPSSVRFTLDGTVTPSLQPAGSFTANWWQKTLYGTAKMKTEVPVIKIGGANLTLTTNSNGPFGQLIGGETLDFPIVQQFNTFDHAQMSVNTLVP